MTEPHSRTQRPLVLRDTGAAALPGMRKHSFIERLSSLLLREPEDRAQLIEVLHHAHERELVDADALSMMEGVLQVSELSARDIMIPRPRMDSIAVDETPDQIVATMLETGHSRFPVFEGERDNIIGVLLAKDLLRLTRGEMIDLRALLRPVVFIPEAKRLNVLLRDFRSNRNHLAIVVDEYGGVAGLITIEDVLEQIVGDIEDEYDEFGEDENMILAAGDGRFRVRGLTELADFNDRFGTSFEPDGIETVGGLVADHVGHVPRRGEIASIGSLRFEVLRADAKQVHLVLVERDHTDAATEDGE
jgi:magnesium and cobalt transporter